MSHPPPTNECSTVDLWVFSIGANERLSELEAVLRPEELARCQRLVSADDRMRFTMGRGLLRTILADYLSMPAILLRLGNGQHGKPQVEGSGEPLYFNLTHSGVWAALAVSRTCEVGIDIEMLRPIRTGFAERFFSTGERKSLAEFSDHERLEGLFRCWTRKEAVVKAQGVGLLGNFRSFDVTLGKEVEQRVSGLPGPWSLVSFTPAPGYVGALAAKAPQIEVVRRYLGSVWPVG